MSLFGSAAGAIAGGVLNAFGQGMANNANAALAIADRDFQREVLQNRHQWETQDYQKAGFNRIMALNSSGGTGSPTAIAMQNPLAGLGEGVSSAVDKVQAEKQLKSLIKQRDYQNKNIEADTHYKYAGAFLADEQTKKYEQEIEQLRRTMPYIEADFKNRAASSAMDVLVKDSQIQANRAQAGQASSAGAYYEAQKEGQEIENNYWRSLGNDGRMVSDAADMLGFSGSRKFLTRFGRGISNELEYFRNSSGKEKVRDFHNNYVKPALDAYTSFFDW